MSFYRERIIKKPRKPYICDWCGKPITGEHLYISGINGNGFGTMRSHVECNKEMSAHCGKCSQRGCCTSYPRDCWEECQELKGARK